MKKLTLICPLLVSTTMFSSPSYAEWRRFSESDNRDVYYLDADKIRRQGDIDDLKVVCEVLFLKGRSIDVGERYHHPY